PAAARSACASRPGTASSPAGTPSRIGPIANQRGHLDERGMSSRRVPQESNHKWRHRDGRANTRNRIVRYQNDPEACDGIAKALGTKKDVELTVRRSVDVWMNSVSTHEASSKEVDAYRCHPNRIKALRCGQAYLAQSADFTAVHLQEVPALPKAVPPPPKMPDVEGLALHDLFLQGGGGRIAR